MSAKFCPHCGTKAPSLLAKFCVSCGNPLDSFEKKRVAPKKPTRRLTSDEGEDDCEDDDDDMEDVEIPDLESVKASISRANSRVSMDADFQVAQSFSFTPDGFAPKPFKRRSA